MNASPAATGMRALRSALAELRIDELRIQAVGGVVYLHGVAPCYRSKRQAADCAERLMAGARIQNEIRVAERAYVDDADVEREVTRRIALLGSDVSGRVSVEVRDAVVSLYGRVSGDAERHRILDAVAAVACVRGVEDHLILEGLEQADTEVSRALAEYVRRAMNLPPGVVTVSWSSGIATLTGSVATETQRQAIEELVLWHDHVTDVVNRIRIVPNLNAPTQTSRVRPGELAP